MTARFGKWGGRAVALAQASTVQALICWVSHMHLTHAGPHYCRAMALAQASVAELG